MLRSSVYEGHTEFAYSRFVSRYGLVNLGWCGRHYNKIDTWLVVDLPTFSTIYWVSNTQSDPTNHDIE